MGAPTYMTVEQIEKTPCKTPGCVYSTAINPHKIRLDIELPVEMLSDLDQVTTRELVKEFHLAILPVVERLFQDRWHLIAGKKLPGDKVHMPATWAELTEENQS